MIAAASHRSAEAASGQTPEAWGIGAICQSIRMRPTWMRGNMPAVHTAQMVMSSAGRAIPLRHFFFVSRRMADKRVPAWPKPIQKTNRTISQPQGTLLFTPRTPTPSVAMRRALPPSPHAASIRHRMMAMMRCGFAGDWHVGLFMSCVSIACAKSLRKTVS